MVPPIVDPESPDRWFVVTQTTVSFFAAAVLLDSYFRGPRRVGGDKRQDPCFLLLSLAAVAWGFASWFGADLSYTHPVVLVCSCFNSALLLAAVAYLDHPPPLLRFVGLRQDRATARVPQTYWWFTGMVGGLLPAVTGLLALRYGERELPVYVAEFVSSVLALACVGYGLFWSFRMRESHVLAGLAILATASMIGSQVLQRRPVPNVAKWVDGITSREAREILTLCSKTAMLLLFVALYASWLRERHDSIVGSADDLADSDRTPGREREPGGGPAAVRAATKASVEPADLFRIGRPAKVTPTRWKVVVTAPGDVAFEVTLSEDQLKTLNMFLEADGQPLTAEALGSPKNTSESEREAAAVRGLAKVSRLRAALGASLLILGGDNDYRLLGKMRSDVEAGDEGPKPA